MTTLSEPAVADATSVGASALSSLPLVRLLQLASPALPIGGYSYSQGLEAAIDAGTIGDAAGAQRWIGDMLRWVMARGEAPVVARLAVAADGADWAAFRRWNAWFRATRETAELRAESQQMGQSLIRLALDLGLVDAPARAALPALAPIGLPAAFALAARGFALPVNATVAAYVWSWLENQVLAVIKLMPVGQVAGQRMLQALGATIPAIAAKALATADDDVAAFAPGLALASARHETQYSRLFRS